MTELKSWQMTEVETQDLLIGARHGGEYSMPMMRLAARQQAVKLIKWLGEQCTNPSQTHGVYQPTARIDCTACFDELKAWAKQIEEGK